jgi:CheY-like chemotaxis protein
MEKPLILAVEDDPTGGLLLGLLCNRYGCDLYVATNCDEAVNAIKTFSSFSLVLMDVRLPGKSGLECTQLIREVENVHGFHIPIVAVTANAMVGDKEACLAAGMDDYVSKPFSIQQFKALLDKWVKFDGDGKIVRFPPKWGGRQMDV